MKEKLRTRFFICWMIIMVQGISGLTIYSRGRAICSETGSAFSLLTIMGIVVLLFTLPVIYYAGKYFAQLQAIFDEEKKSENKA